MILQALAALLTTKGLHIVHQDNNSILIYPEVHLNLHPNTISLFAPDPNGDPLIQRWDLDHCDPTHITTTVRTMVRRQGGRHDPRPRTS